MDTKTAAIIYHRVDFDGICSYAIARKALESEGFDVNPFPYSYCDEDPGAQALSHFDKVVIVDVCLPAETMRCLMGMSRTDPKFDCVWIDHHRTAIRDSVKEGFSLMHGYRQESGAAACALTWDYFHGSRMPEAVEYISAYDVHDKVHPEWERKVLPYQYGMRERYAQRAEEFLTDYAAIMYEKDFTSKVISNGAAILNYARDTGERGVSVYGFPVSVAGDHKGLCCLTNAMGSLGFERSMERNGYEIAICANRIRADLYKVSMYGSDANTLDLGAYMKENYRGGGHFNAAGGTLDLNQFMTLITRQTI